MKTTPSNEQQLEAITKSAQTADLLLSDLIAAHRIAVYGGNPALEILLYGFLEKTRPLLSALNELNERNMAASILVAKRRQRKQ